MTNFAQWGNQLYSGERSYPIVQHRRMFLTIGGVVAALCLVAIAVLQLNPSIDFTGGSQFTVAGAGGEQQPAYDAVESEGITTESVKVSTLGSDSVRVQTEVLDTDATNALRAALAEAYGVDVGDVQTASIGPSWGEDVTQRAAQSVVIFIVIITILMTLYFRSWSMSAAAMIGLVHDMVVTVGIFALTQVTVSPSTVVGFLTILGYSLYDTVVVFDKVRELTRGVFDQKRYTFGELVNLAVNQTLVRSINTSIVALLPVASILVLGTITLGSTTLTDISLALFIGMLVGAFSSLFIASPLLVTIEYRRAHVREHTAAVLEARAGGEDGDSAGAGGDFSTRVAPVIPGRHLGQEAQPKRTTRSQR